MLQSAWLFLGVVAVLATGAAVGTTDDGLAIIAGVAGFVTWGVVAYGSFRVEVVGETQIFKFTMPVVALTCLALSLVPGYIALTGPIQLARRATGTQPEDV